MWLTIGLAIGVLAGEAVALWEPAAAVAGTAALAAACLWTVVWGPLRRGIAIYAERRTFNSVWQSMPWRRDERRVDALVAVIAGLVSELASRLPDEVRLDQEMRHLESMSARRGSDKEMPPADGEFLAEVVRSARQAVADATQRYPRTINRTATATVADLEECAQHLRAAIDRIQSTRHPAA